MEQTNALDGATVFTGNNGKIPLRNSRFAVPSRMNVRNVMASPPTVATSTSNPIAGRYWPAVGNEGDSVNAKPQGSYFTFTRGGGFVLDSTSNYYFTWSSNVNYGGGLLLPNGNSFSFIHTGTQFAIKYGAYGGDGFLVKVDDQYITMTPQGNINDGSWNYYSVVFGGAGRRRIEIINAPGSHPNFGGIYTDATDTIEPAPVRGPRAIFIGDSFVEGSLATAGPASNFPVVFGELMGWDDVWNSGVGATGYLAAPGGKLKYRDRFATDVYPYNPDIVFLTGGYNDIGSGAAATATEHLACIKALQQNLPNALICTVSPFLNKGAAYAASNLLLMRGLFKANCVATGTTFIDVQQMPLPAHITPQVTTLAASSSANATSLSTTAKLFPYSTYQFADGTEFVCTAASGSGPYTATVDNSANAQSGGATITQVGDCLWTGSGHVGATTGVGNSDILVGSDGTHPTQASHEAIAEAIAYAFMNQLYSN